MHLWTFTVLVTPDSSSVCLTNDWCLQVRKLQDKVSKCQDNVKKSKDQYELAVSDINNYNSRYQEVKHRTGGWPGHDLTWLFLRIWRMYLNVVSGRRPRGCRHLKTLYSKYTNVWTSARTRRKLKQPFSGWTHSKLTVNSPQGYRRFTMNFITRSTMLIMRKTCGGGPTLTVSICPWLGLSSR